MSNLGKWNEWYKNLNTVEAYGDTITYEIGASFLRSCQTIEDWGCGKGWFRRFTPNSIYVGIDGSNTPWADKVVDLAEYTSQVEGIFMRHVLEHNTEWKRVLENALDSFTKRMVLVLFTPFVEETKQIAFVPEVGVPDMAFARKDLEDIIEASGATWKLTDNIKTETSYGVEHVYLISRY